MTHKNFRIGLAAVLAVGTLTGLLVSQGCSSSNNSGTPGTVTPAAAPTPTVTVSIAPGAANLGSAAYGTNPLEITPSDVVWVNGDTTPHSATSDTGVFDTGVIQPGASSSPIPFQSPGTFPYGSSVTGDAGMSGELVVASPSPSPSPSASPSASPSPSPSPSASPSPSPSASSSTTPTPVAVTIPVGAMGMGSAAYGQNPLTVPVGTSVTWTNGDTIAHTVTANDGSYDSGSLQPGQTFSHTYSAAGSYPYYCTIHGMASMNGMVVAQ